MAILTVGFSSDVVVTCGRCGPRLTWGWPQSRQHQETGQGGERPLSPLPTTPKPYLLRPLRAIQLARGSRAMSTICRHATSLLAAPSTRRPTRRYRMPVPHLAPPYRTGLNTSLTLTMTLLQTSTHHAAGSGPRSPRGGPRRAARGWPVPSGLWTHRTAAHVSTRRETPSAVSGPSRLQSRTASQWGRADVSEAWALVSERWPPPTVASVALPRASARQHRRPDPAC